MAKSIIGAAAGAGAATAYLRPDVVAGYVLGGGGPGLFSSSGSFGSSEVKSELDRLALMVRELSRDVSSRQGVTIVQRGESRAGYATYAVSVVGLGTVAYLVVWKGWRLSDFFYVTRRQMKQGMSMLGERLDVLSNKLLEVRNRLHSKILEVIGKQNEALAAQERMSKHLERVGKDVESTAGQVRQIHGMIFDMDASLNEVGQSQRHTNQGIYILCQAVNELMVGHSFRAKTDLLEYTRSPIWKSQPAQQGWGSLLKDGSDATAQPFLLSGATLREAEDQGKSTGFAALAADDDFDAAPPAAVSASGRDAGVSGAPNGRGLFRRAW